MLRKKQLFLTRRIDNRYSEECVVSHAGSSVKSFNISKAREIFDYIDDSYDVIAIDEVQFFDEEIVQICDYFADRRQACHGGWIRYGFRGVPFSVMPELFTHAEFVTKLTAVCTKCGAPATRTQRLVNGKPASYDDPIIVVGASEQYEARCRHCHEVEGRPQIHVEMKK